MSALGDLLIHYGKEHCNGVFSSALSFLTLPSNAAAWQG